MGKRAIIISEITLLLIFFAFFSVKTAAIYFKIEDDTKWFVVIYADSTHSNKIHYSFPLDKVVYIENKELNFISRKQIGFRTKDVSPINKKKYIDRKQYYIPQVRY
jgi:hypothetical protein